MIRLAFALALLGCTPAPRHYKSPRITVHAASYPVGCDSLDEEQCKDYNRPRHVVALPAFEISAGRVTQWEYQECVEKDGGGCPAPDPAPACDWDPIRHPNWPASCVTLDAARAYCASVGGAVPTIEEANAACAGVEGRIYPWGDQAPTPARANFGGENLVPSRCDGSDPACNPHAFDDEPSRTAGATPEGLVVAGQAWTLLEPDAPPGLQRPGNFGAGEWPVQDRPPVWMLGSARGYAQPGYLACARAVGSVPPLPSAPWFNDVSIRCVWRSDVAQVAP